MATKPPTKDVALPKDQTLAKAAQAVELRQRGVALRDILDETGFATYFELVAAMREYSATLVYETVEGRNLVIQNEIEGLNQLLTRMWAIIDNPPGKYNKDGDWLEADSGAVINATKTASDLIWKKVQLLGLLKEDIKELGAETIIISRDRGTYLEDLKKISESD